MVAFADEASLVVETVLPRKNFFVRTDERQRRNIIAANLDQVLVVVATNPLPSRDLVERYLLAVHSLGMQAVIVHNKTDLEPDPYETANRVQVLEHMPDYEALGYTVIRTSCKAATGIDDLKAVLKNRTSILVGQSGVGKSSLINQLIPDLKIQTGELSSTTGKGTHTTTSTIMYQLAEGGYLIDSPGVWEYGIWKLENHELAAGFIEFEPWLGQCRFNNCLHISEPDCAIKRAVEDGLIRDWRFRSYFRLMEQNT